MPLDYQRRSSSIQRKFPSEKSVLLLIFTEKFILGNKSLDNPAKEYIINN